MTVEVVTYKANGNHKPQWTGYCVLENEILWVRFEGDNEGDVIAKARAWYANEHDRQKRLIAGYHELNEDDVPNKPYKNPKGNAGADWNWSSVEKSDKEHGMNGKIWLVHHSQQKRARVEPSRVDAMIVEGWERGGPKTAFRGGW